ncbi:hypothetical protein BCEP4_880006 [Burkholderia cepacia]|nr:hypothetical protein BCEP4_880006 [Burkholderia cepacia]
MSIIIRLIFAFLITVILFSNHSRIINHGTVKSTDLPEPSDLHTIRHQSVQIYRVEVSRYLYVRLQIAPRTQPCPFSPSNTRLAPVRVIHIRPLTSAETRWLIPSSDLTNSPASFNNQRQRGRSRRDRSERPGPIALMPPHPGKDLSP